MVVYCVNMRYLIYVVRAGVFGCCVPVAAAIVVSLRDCRQISLHVFDTLFKVVELDDWDA